MQCDGLAVTSGGEVVRLAAGKRMASPQWAFFSSSTHRLAEGNYAMMRCPPIIRRYRAG